MRKFLYASTTMALLVQLTAAVIAAPVAPAAPATIVTAVPAKKATLDPAAVERAFEASTASLKPFTYGPAKTASIRAITPPKNEALLVLDGAAYVPRGTPQASVTQVGPPSAVATFTDGFNDPAPIELGAQVWLVGTNLGGLVNGKQIIPTVKVRTMHCSAETAVPVLAVSAGGDEIELDFSHVNYKQINTSDTLRLTLSTASGTSEARLPFAPQQTLATMQAAIGVTGMVDHHSPIFAGWTYDEYPDGLTRVFVGTQVEGTDHFKPIPMLNGWADYASSITFAPGKEGNVGAAAVPGKPGNMDVTWYANVDYPYATYTVNYAASGAAQYRSLPSQPKLGGLCED